MITASIEIKAQFYDLDPMQIVWHGNYVRFFEQARSALLDRISYNYNEMYESGYAWPIVDMRLKYVKPIHFAQEVIIEAKLVEYESRLKIEYLITDKETGHRINKGYTVQVAVGIEDQEMRLASPDVLINLVEAYQCV
ncbi:acyl-CoA thioesterase [Curvivirga aplysinae]|uniref:acyl-CoA thioesterase n=1 Tax=Curvivirga aplysinae TaxID=2529852 RepID=UPI0012BCCA7E|nr:acyl-CoA thioesterase [Curvivirga aplysinae]MTI11028.1 acyl-CoA thioesterase [Curvivirga aplysinae]